MVPNAIAALDDLKAAGFTLAEPVESSRRQLRSYLGWAPNAPVSLAEALAPGWVPAIKRHENVPSYKQSITVFEAALGGRGEAYENLLRAVAEAISNHPELG